MRLSEIAKEVIRLAEERRKYWSVELPRRHPNYPLVQAGEDSGPPPLADKQLRELMYSLSPEETYQLTMLMYLGRGDFGTEDLASEYRNVCSTFAEPRWATTQMVGKAPLGDYLRDGLETLALAQVDIDNLPIHAQVT